MSGDKDFADQMRHLNTAHKDRYMRSDHGESTGSFGPVPEFNPDGAPLGEATRGRSKGRLHSIPAPWLKKDGEA